MDAEIIFWLIVDLVLFGGLYIALKHQPTYFGNKREEFEEIELD